MQSTRPYTTKHDRPLLLQDLSEDLQSRILNFSNPQIAIDVLAYELYCDDLRSVHRDFLYRLKSEQNTTSLLIQHHRAIHRVESEELAIEKNDKFAGWIFESNGSKFCVLSHPHQGLELIRVKDGSIVWRSSGRFYDDESGGTAIDNALNAAQKLSEL